jgi:hypothetical protein
VHEDLAVFVQQFVDRFVRRAIAYDTAIERVDECMEHLALNHVRNDENTALSLTESNQETSALLLCQEHRAVLGRNVTKEPSAVKLVTNKKMIKRGTYGFLVQFLKHGRWNKNVM